LAASLYRTPNGYPVQQALEDQVRVLDWFDAHVGRPEHVISWGASGGGLTSVLLGERNPHRIDGVLSMCRRASPGSTPPHAYARTGAP
jgi:acetyl esterase/lipase